MEQLELSYAANGKVKTVQPFWKRVWECLKKLNIHLAYDSVNLLSGVFPKEIKVYVHTKNFN